MAISLLMLDSFGHYDANNNATKYPDGGYNINGGDSASYSISASFGRNGGGLRIATAAGNNFSNATMLERRHGLVASSRWGFGFAFKIVDIVPEEMIPLFSLTDTGTIYGYLGLFYATQVGICLTKSQTIGIFSGEPPGTLLLGGTKPIKRNIWHYAEADILISATGTLVLTIDGEVIGTYAGDTRGTGSSSADGIRIGFSKMGRLAGGVGGRYIYVDDLYVTSGGNVSDINVRVALPTADGSVNNWTPLTATNHEMVDDTTMDEDATYMFAASAPLDSVFPVTDIGALTNVHVPGIQINAAGRTAFSNPIADLKGAVRSGGVTSYSAASAMATPYALPGVFDSGWSFVNRTEIFPFSLNPASGGTFTPSTLSLLEFGVERNA